MKNFFLHTLTCSLLLACFSHAEERIPFYEDFIESGNLPGYLIEAHKFLDENPQANESPRVALDLIMMGKAAEDLKSVVRGTNLLLFDYLGSLPSLHFISSFDKGSPRLTQLLKVKLDEADLNDHNFSNSYGDTIVLLARIHGPELMNDPLLLLSSYLVIAGSDNKELLTSLSNALDVLEEKNEKFAPLARICRSDDPPSTKISKLLDLSSHETAFFIKYFTTQLTDDEKYSPEFLESMINATLFGVPPRPELALTHISSLPDETSTLPKFQVSNALAHLLSGNRESALTVLNSLSASTAVESSPWIDVARSLLDGIEFGDSRKALFLEQLTKLYERSQRESESYLIEGSWMGSDPANSFNFQMGINQNNQTFEIHFTQKETSFFSYKVQPNQCFILTPSGKNISFSNGGAYPLPQIEINRDVEAGAFNYSFNLNFSKSFDDFTSQVSENLAIPYLSTPKGREVLLNHFLERKAIWLVPPASSEKGTAFTLNKIDPVLISKNYKVEISPTGELATLALGKLRITNFRQGTEEVLNTLPQWPDHLPQASEKEFQISLLIDSIGDLMKMASSNLREE